MKNKRIVHVVGTGTIGEPLIGLLAIFRHELGIDEVTFQKRTPGVTDRSKVLSLQKKEAILAVDREVWEKFSAMGMKPVYEAHEAIHRASVVIDCTHLGNQNKEQFYLRCGRNSQGFIGQGSAFGFGKMYARGINDRVLRHGEDRFIQVASSNTHNLAVLVDTVALGPEKENDLERGYFLCMRRVNDLSEDTAFLPSPEVEMDGDVLFGTHHARDAYHLFKTLGLNLNLYSSAIKLNTQYMHVLHFSIRLRRGVSMDDIMERLRSNPRVALTQKSLASLVFSFGRDHGPFGRILNQVVIPAQCLAVKKRSEVIGFGFTPHDGNSLLSNIAAAEWFLYQEDYQQRIQCIERRLFPEI